MVVSEAPCSNLLTIQAGNSKLNLLILKTSLSTTIKVLGLQPGISQVGSKLDEAKQLRHQHDELIIRFNAKRKEHQALLDGESEEKRKISTESWEHVFSFLEARKGLLDQSVSFYTASQSLFKKLQQLESQCNENSLSSDAEGAKRDLERHQNMRKAILEATMTTLQEGQTLLEKLRKASMDWGGLGGNSCHHVTTSGCYHIEQLIVNLRFKKLHLEELWLKRKVQLEQCIIFMMLKEEVNQLLKWLEDTEDPLTKKHLGLSEEECHRIVHELSTVQHQFAPLPHRLKHFLSRLQLLNDDALAGEVAALKDQLLQAEEKVDSVSTELLSRLRNLHLLLSFFASSREANSRLESLAVLADGVKQATFGQAQAYTRLCENIYDATVIPLREGEILLAKLQKGPTNDDAIGNISFRVKSIEDKISILKGNAPQAYLDECNKNKALSDMEEKFYKLNSWYVLIGQSTFNRYHKLPSGLAEVNDFLLSHRSLCEEVKIKHLEVKELQISLNKLTENFDAEKVSTENKEKKKESNEKQTEEKKLGNDNDKILKVLKEKLEKTEEQYSKLHEQLEKRGKLALSFIILLKRERQVSAQAGVFEDQMSGLHDKRSCSEVNDSVLACKEEFIKKLSSDIEEFTKNGKSFLEEAEQIKANDPITIQAVVALVATANRELERSKEILNSHFTQWKSVVNQKTNSSTQRKKLFADVKKTIEWIIKAEDDFFPKIAGELGASLGEVQANQKRLDDFKSTAQKVHSETEAHLKASELLYLEEEGPLEDPIIQHLLTTQNRFQARISEYQHLLNKSGSFFQNLSQLDALIDATEKSYKNGELSNELKGAKEAVETHKSQRDKLKGLIEATCNEGGGIVVRVRQEDAQERAKSEVRRRLQSAERERKQWHKNWEEHKERLEEGLVLCRFYFDLKQLQNELDVLQRQLDNKQGNFGSSASAVQSFIQAYEQLKSLAKEVGEREKKFGVTADRMIQDGHYDSRRIRHEVDETHRRWKHFENSLGLIDGQLKEAQKFYQLNGQCEDWVNEAGQFLLGVSRRAPSCKSSEEVENLVKEIETFRKEEGDKQDGRLKNMEVIITTLYGQVRGPQRMQGILEQTQAVYNAFIRTIEELRGLKGNLANTETILAQVEKVIDRRAPKLPVFTAPLHDAEVTEGLRFTFECQLECDTATPQVEWFRENESVRGFISSYKNGLCQLHIEETLIADSATYTCQATTPSGITKTSAKLFVKASEGKHYVPEFLKHLRAAEVPEGTSHTFECSIASNPAATVQWFLNDAELPNNNDYVISNDHGRCSLKIRRLNRNTHNGKVRFKATNPEGEAVTSANLTVFAVKKPEFTTPLKDNEVEEGGSIKLYCNYTGQPPPQIQWFLNDSPILPSVLFKITVGDDHTSLEIKEVFAEDCGTYSVTANNLGGEARTSCLIALTNRDAHRQETNKQTEKPKFVGPLSNKICTECDRVSFECYVAAHPAPEIFWFHNGKPIKKTKDFDFTYDPVSGRCVLYIHETFVEDSGTYVCQAKNPFGSDTTSCRLSVQPLPEKPDSRFGVGSGEVPPKFTQLLKDIEATEGDHVSFECRVIGHPAPLIKWFQGRNPIENGPDFFISSENEVQTLTIRKVHRHDVGNYMVKATNDAGIAKCYATLVVKQRSEHHAMKVRLVESSHSVQTDVPVQSGHIPPEIIKSFHDVHVRPGQPCNIEVVITGVPKPKIQWLFNNEVITSGPYRISCLGDVHSLHIPRVTDNDVGRFSVIAENDAGKAWCSALLVVVDQSQLVGEAESPPETPQMHQSIQRSRKYIPACKPLVSDLPPKFFAELSNITSPAGGRVTLKALVEGRPEPLVTWYKDGRDLTANPDYEISCKAGVPQLVILNAKQDHSGEYSCVAKNNLGSARSQARVTIEAAGFAPKLIEGLQPNTSARAGETVRFVVLTRGEPKPTVSWFKNSIQIQPSPDFVVSSDGHKNILLLPRAYVEDSGFYEVRIENPHGRMHTSTRLNVQPVVEVPKQAPQFVKPLHNMSVMLDQRAVLECTVPLQTHPVDVKWTHNNQTLYPSNNHSINFEPQIGLCQLIIHKVTQPLRGRYVCTIVINGLSKSTAMDLDVNVPPPEKQPCKPHFVEHLRNQVSDDSSDVFLACRVQGQPVPSIKWLHNGQLLIPSNKHAIKFQQSNGLCSLLIQPTSPEDQGIYTCVASNALGEEYSSAELKVRIRSPMLPKTHLLSETFKSREIGGVAELYFKPIFKRIPADLFVPEGHVARFDCLVIGRPTPDVYWFREGVRVHEDWMHKIVINEEGINSIIIEAVTPQDAGQYLCIARNRAGEDRFNVGLNVLARRAPAPPRFCYRIPNQSAKVGHPVSFTVEIEGIPQPQVTWLKNDQAIHHGGKYHILGDNYKTTLHIPHVTKDDDGNYSCMATSQTGTSHNRFRLNVEDVDEISKGIRSVSPRTTVLYTQPSARLTPSPAPVRRSPSPSFRLVSSQRTVSETTLKTVHTGSIKSPEESVAAPSLLEPMKDQLVPVGGTAHFRCRIVSQQPPQHQWYFENSPLPNIYGKYHTYEREGGLYGLDIEGVTEADAGLYKVTAENKGGEVTCIAHLKVGVQPSTTVTTRVRATPSPVPFMHPPHIIKPLNDLRVDHGSFANFEVVFDGPGFDKIEWFVNNSKIKDGQDGGNVTIHKTPTRSSLFINQVTPLITGKVRCVASSENGQVESTATLSIRGVNSPRGSVAYSPQPPQFEAKSLFNQHLSIPQASFAPQQRSNSLDILAPIFTKSLNSFDARDGSEITLSCSYKGQKPVNVSWYHNGVCIDESQDFAINVDADQGVTELVIVDCMQDDNGEFKCLAQNAYGQAETHCFLSVIPSNQPYAAFSTSFDTQYIPPEDVSEKVKFLNSISIFNNPELQFDMPILLDKAESQRVLEKTEVVESDEIRKINKQTKALQLKNFKVTNNMNLENAIKPNVINKEITKTHDICEKPTTKVKTLKNINQKSAFETITSKDTEKINKNLYFESQINDQVVMDGRSVLMKTWLRGSPMPEEVVWSKDGVRLEDNVCDVSTFYSKETGEIILSIAEVFPEDGGLYECYAETNKGIATLLTKLKVEAYEYIPDSEESCTEENLSQISGINYSENRRTFWDEAYSIKRQISDNDESQEEFVEAGLMKGESFSNRVSFDNANPDKDFENYLRLFKLNAHRSDQEDSDDTSKLSYKKVEEKIITENSDAKFLEASKTKDKVFDQSSEYEFFDASKIDPSEDEKMFQVENIDNIIASGEIVAEPKLGAADYKTKKDDMVLSGASGLKVGEQINQTIVFKEVIHLRDEMKENLMVDGVKAATISSNKAKHVNIKTDVIESSDDEYKEISEIEDKFLEEHVNIAEKKDNVSDVQKSEVETPTEEFTETTEIGEKIFLKDSRSVDLNKAKELLTATLESSDSEFEEISEIKEIYLIEGGASKEKTSSKNEKVGKNLENLEIVHAEDKITDDLVFVNKNGDVFENASEGEKEIKTSSQLTAASFNEEPVEESSNIESSLMFYDESSKPKLNISSVISDNLEKYGEPLKSADLTEDEFKGAKTKELYHNAMEHRPVGPCKRVSSVKEEIVPFEESDVVPRPLNHAKASVNKNMIGVTSLFESESFTIEKTKMKKISFNQLEYVLQIARDYCLIFPMILATAYDEFDGKKPKNKKIKLIKQLKLTQCAEELITDRILEKLCKLINLYNVDEILIPDDDSNAYALKGLAENSIKTPDEVLNEFNKVSEITVLPCRALPDLIRFDGDDTIKINPITTNGNQINIAPFVIEEKLNNSKVLKIPINILKSRKIKRSLSLDSFKKVKKPINQHKLTSLHHLKKFFSQIVLDKKSSKVLASMPSLKKNLQQFGHQESFLSLISLAKKSLSINSSDEDSLYSHSSSHKNSSKTSTTYEEIDSIGRYSPLKKDKFLKLKKLQNDSLKLQSKEKDFNSRVVFDMNSIQIYNFCLHKNLKSRSQDCILLCPNDIANAQFVEKNLALKCETQDEKTPKMLEVLENQEVLDGSKVELVCRMKTVKEIEDPVWFVDGVQISPSDDMIIETTFLTEKDTEKQENKFMEYIFRLTINDVLLEDEGLYTVAVKSFDHILYSSAYLSVLDVNNVLSMLPADEEDYEDSATKSNNVNEEELEEVEETEELIENKIYRNKRTNIKSNCKEDPKTKKTENVVKIKNAPVLSKVLDDQCEIMEDTSLNLHCSTELDSNFRVSWFEDGVEIDESHPRIKVWKNGKDCHLSIESIKLEDRGIYACLISDEKGSVETSTEVFVLRKESQRNVLNEEILIEAEVRMAWMQTHL